MEHYLDDVDSLYGSDSGLDSDPNDFFNTLRQDLAVLDLAPVPPSSSSPGGFDKQLNDQNHPDVYLGHQESIVHQLRDKTGASLLSDDQKASFQKLSLASSPDALVPQYHESYLPDYDYYADDNYCIYCADHYWTDYHYCTSNHYFPETSEPSLFQVTEPILFQLTEPSLFQLESTPDHSPPAPPSPPPSPFSEVKGKASTKHASRLFALDLTLKGFLPSTKPSFVTTTSWNRLNSGAPIVKLVECTTSYITLRFDEAFDVIIHSLANYGITLSKHTPQLMTRFRWWSDFKHFPFIKVNNKKLKDSEPLSVLRKISLPLNLLSNERIVKLWKAGKDQILLMHFSRFIHALYERYVDEQDGHQFEASGFGSTRKRPRSQIFDSALSERERLNLIIAEAVDATLADLESSSSLR